MDRTSEVRKVLLITLSLNVLVSGAKIFYGYLVYSVAITSDGYHSLFDGVSNIVGLVAIYLASHPPDSEHPYGHRKFETFFTIFIGLFMLLTCFEIFKDVYRSLKGGNVARVDTGSFVIMSVTMAINIFVAIYERRMGARLDSEFLVADSRHTMSDIYVTAGVIVSLVFLKLGFPMADPVAGIVVGLFVARAGIMIIVESADVLVDKTQADALILKKITGSIEGVLECHEIRTRGTKNDIFVDMHVLVDPAISVGEAHLIAHRVEEKIKKEVPEIVDVVVHIEPSSSG